VNYLTVVATNHALILLVEDYFVITLLLL